MNEKILEISNLSVMMKERFLVKNVTFSVEQGECIGIIGSKRSGKTSLLKALSGSLPITEGQVFFCGKDLTTQINNLSPTMGVCLDPPVFFKYQTVLNNMQYLSMLSGNYNVESIIEALKKFSLAQKINEKVAKLSYYEKKLMALALAFLTEPKVLLLDEPFKTLPENENKNLHNFIQEIQRNGTSIIISSEDIENIEEICDRFIFMENRCIKEILTNNACKKINPNMTYMFVEVKHPHYAGKLIIENYNLNVKLLDKKVLFESDEDTTADIVEFLTKKKIIIYKAGAISKKAEQIFAELTSNFKEDGDE